MTTFRALLLLGAVALLVAACGDEKGGGKDYGDYELASLTEPCEGHAGLTGQAALDGGAAVLAYTTTAGYITAAGGSVDHTRLDVGFDWPDEPVATCYPPFEEEIVPGTIFTQQERVAIHGLRGAYATADGQLSEDLSTTAWLLVFNSAIQAVQITSVTTRGNLDGSWEPFPDYEPIGNTILFVTSPNTITPDSSFGNFGMGPEKKSELEAGIFKSRFVMAMWPDTP